MGKRERERERERESSELKYFDYASLTHTLQSTLFIGLTAKNQSLKNNSVATPDLNKKQSNSRKEVWRKRRAKVQNTTVLNSD